MSRDIVDDLEAAEDHIGCLESAARRAATEIECAIAVNGTLSAAELIELRSLLVIHLGYCRSSCAAGECEDGCGCQAHGDDDHPGWRPRRTLDAIHAEFGVSVNEYDPEEPYVLIEQHADTNERYVTTHQDVDSARKYSAGQEDGWRPLALVNLETGGRFQATVQRVVEFELLDATEPAI